MIKRRVKNIVKAVIGANFRVFQRFGFDILPRHFYSEIPYIAKLKKSEKWKKPYPMNFIGSDIGSQKHNFQLILSTINDLDAERLFDNSCRANNETGYSKVDSSVLYAFVNYYKPKRIIQAGCGVSTAVILEAAEHAGVSVDITCIDPYPNSYIRELSEMGKVSLIAEPVETIDRSIFLSLEADDFVFFDTSHVLGPAGESSRIILEILPIIPKDVYVHFHDIWFPYDYPHDILYNALFFWHETVLLLAYLNNNDKYEVRFSMAMLHFMQQEWLKQVLIYYHPGQCNEGLTIQEGDFPSSIYLRAK